MPSKGQLQDFSRPLAVYGVLTAVLNGAEWAIKMKACNNDSIIEGWDGQ